MKLLFKLLMRIGLISSGPAVSSITSATQAEGTSLVHTVTLASAVAVIDGLYPFSLSGVTATSGTDYTATPTFSAGVTRSGGTLTVPVGVSSFTITVSTTNDTVYEGTETYSITVGGMTNTGTITDDESAPTIASVSSASATEGSNIVHTVAVTGVAQASRTFALAFSGTAVGGTDYNATPTFSAGVTLSGGNIRVPAGVTSFTVTVGTINNALTDGSRAYTLTIGGASGTGSILDDETPSPAFTATLTALTNATGVVTTLAYINGGGGGGTITPSVTESVSSGVAPLAVFFDATASTSTQTTRPQHDVFYMWDFGDTGAGTWSNGTGANTSRNVAYGPVASHVFDAAGTYTVTLTAHDGVSTQTTTKTITVTAADTEWAGTKTVCYSTGSDFTGAPAGCVQVPNVTNLSTSFAANIGSGNKRHLFKKGDTFNITTKIRIDKGGPSYVGAFGTGANPIINMTVGAQAIFGLSNNTTPTGVSNWRFEDLTLDCNDTSSNCFVGDGSISKVLVNRCYMTRCGKALQLDGSTINALNASVPYTHAMWDEFYFVNSTIYDLQNTASGPCAFFASSRRAVVMGCNIDNNSHGEHGIRFQLMERGVVNNNTVQGIAATKTNLTIRSSDYAGSNTLLPGVMTQKVVISDNKLIGGASVGMVGFGPENGVIDERAENIIFERNLLVGTSTTQNTVLVSQRDVTIRNNMVTLPAGTGGGFAFGVQPSGIVPNPTRVHVYNNSVYHGGNSTNRWALFYVSINNDVSPYDQTMPGSTFEAKNNILYCPNKPASWYTMTYKDIEAQSVTTASNNTPDASNTTSPLFAVNPPTAVAHFTPGSGSYANGTGVNVKNWRDFYNTATQATPDMGAVVI